MVLLGTASVLAGDFDQLLGAGIGWRHSGSPIWPWHLPTREEWVLAMSSSPDCSASFSGGSAGGLLLSAAFAAFLLGGLFSIGLLVARKAGRKSGIPFGPWMLIGAPGWAYFLARTSRSGYLALVGLS